MSSSIPPFLKRVKRCRLALYLIGLLIVTICAVGCQREPKITLTSEVKTQVNKEGHIDHPLGAQAMNEAPTQDQIHAPLRLEHLAHQLKSLLPQARAQVGEHVGLPVPAVTIYLSQNEADMKREATRRHKHHPPEWANGLAYPRQRTIYLHAAPLKELKRTLVHELVHIALGQGASLPLWINEGASVAFSEGISWERMWRLNEASIAGQLSSFHSLTRRFPMSGSVAQIAYAQSAHLVYQMGDRYGDDALRQFLKALTHGRSVDQASRQAFGLSLSEVERRWRRDMERGAMSTLSLFAQESTIWAITIFIFLVGGALKIRQRKRDRPLLDDDHPSAPIDIEILSTLPHASPRFNDEAPHPTAPIFEPPTHSQTGDQDRTKMSS